MNNTPTARPKLHRTARGAAELIVDSFAGGGGASHGIQIALGRPPDIAINHNAEALAMHAENHPITRHFCESVWYVDPVEACAGRPVGLAWFSPDCKHFSKAKGGRPVEGKVRGLAWVAIRWARTVAPRVIVLENVEEFQTWGPLLSDGTPCPDRRGVTFRRWLAALRKCGYEVEVRVLRACDYGAPTSRKRLFIIARNDGAPIVWPQPTHGPEKVQRYRVAADCIDWSIPTNSIFGRTKPLADATLRRIARGIQRFVLDAAQPFIVPVTHAGDARVHSIDEPLRTVTGAHRGELALAVPLLVQTGYGERVGQLPRMLDLGAPLGTVVAGGAKHALAAVFLAKHYGGNYSGAGLAATAPLGTITTVDHHALVASTLIKLRGQCAGADIQQPAPTITAGGTHLAEVRVFFAKFVGAAPQVFINGEAYQIVDIGMRMLTPRELARAQGFPDTYRLEFAYKGKLLSKTAQVRMVGNAVCPPIAAALVAANYTPRSPRKRPRPHNKPNTNTTTQPPVERTSDDNA